MNMSAYQTASESYASLDLETSINSASPHKLILMLYEGAINALLKARILIEHKNIQEKGNEISRAISIIDNGLAMCLNQEQGGDIAKNLASLYEYMTQRLLQANLHNKVEWLDEVIDLLKELRSAWEQIGEQPRAATTKTEHQQNMESVSPVPNSEQSQTSVSYGKV